MSLSWTPQHLFWALPPLEWSLHLGVILVQTDNTTVLSYLNWMGVTRFHSLEQLTQEITQWCLDKGITLLTVHLSGVDNTQTQRRSAILPVE